MQGVGDSVVRSIGLPAAPAPLCWRRTDKGAVRFFASPALGDSVDLPLYLRSGYQLQSVLTHVAAHQIQRLPTHYRLALVHYEQTIAEALGFIHVMGGE